MRSAPAVIIQSTPQSSNWPKGNWTSPKRRVPSAVIASDAGLGEDWGIYPSQAKHGLVTSNPANPVKITRQMRAAAIADAPADKARIVVVAVSAPVAGVINRIALLERSSPDAEAASA